MSANPTHWARMYLHGQGAEYPVSPEALTNVLRSMNEHRDSAVPLKVRLRFEDGSVVVVAPKKGPRAK